MKQVSNDYKNAIIDLGRQYDVKITYGNTTLTNEQLNQVTPHYRSDLLKSVMKQLDLDSNVDIPIGTEINCQFGLKVGNSYEYIDYGNYIVYSSEKQEDLLSYRIVCYDKMLYAMKDYEDLELTYPISIKDYISAIATKIGLEFEDDDFTNADKEIPEEKYLDEDGNTLGYTYRDVLDELAQVTASIIKVEDNKLKITYPDDVIAETGTFENTSGQITTDSKKVLDLEVEGNTYQEQTSGKNLLGIPNGTYSNNGITATVNNGVITLNGTATSNSYINITPIANIVLDGGNYTYSLNNATTGTTEVRLFDTSNNYTSLWATSVNNKRTNSDSRTFNLISIVTTSGNVLNNLVLKPQVEKGSSATSYEKFTYGASPNPNYPQEIQVVTGNQEIEVCGKNLFTTGNGTSSRIGVNATYNGSEVVLNGTTTSAGNIFYDETISINTGYRKSQTLPAGTYTLSTKTTGTATYPSGTGIAIYIRDGSGNILKSFSSIANYQTTLTLNSETIIYSQLYINGSGGVYNNYTIYFQIEKGTATTYEPYIGNTYPIYLPVENMVDLSGIGTQTSPSGVTITDNNDGTYTLNGTATANIVFATSISATLPAGTYTYALNNSAVVGTSGSNSVYCYLLSTETGTNWLFDRYTYQATDSSATTTTTQTYHLNTFRIVIPNGAVLNNLTIGYQIEKGSKKNHFTPYGTTPIELCKINDYKDRIKKSEGKNLLDSLIQGNINTSTGEFEANPNTEFRVSENYIKVDSNKVGVSYITSGTKQIVLYEYKNDYTYITYQAESSDSNLFTLNSETKYIKIRLRGSGVATTDITKAIVSNDSLIPYEPYLAKGKWYIEKKIGKVQYNGTETWTQDTISGGIIYWYNKILDSKKGTRIADVLLSTHFKPNRANDDNGFYLNNQNLIVFNHGIASTLVNYKTWLGNNLPIVYYVLETPTYTEITNEELISQLNSIELLDGLNNISITSANLSSPLKISYISEYETITEDYLKDVNVNFSEKFGPVNSLVLSRSADSDLIYRKDDSSIEKNGLTEIKISDNQILNGNDRDECIDNIFNRLKGIEYYTNDYDSTGITYLELGDFYKVEARGNRYLALMLNDELNVTQGFEELIHTDKPDTSVSDYKKADTTDRRINQATLIVDKQNQTIQALTSRTSNLESKQINDKAELLAKFGDYALDSRVDDITTQVETLQTDTYTKTEVKSILKGTFYDSDNNQIVSEVVKTTSGTFDENGMHYEKTNAKTKSTINEVGVRVDNAINDSELLFAGYDDNINQTIVRTDNLTVRNFLVVGSQSRFQDYEENNEQGTGVFDL